MTQTGFASWIILTVLVLSSLRPIRFLSYEVFFVLHIILIGGLLGSTYLHFDYGAGYFWACIGIYFLDRLVRGIAAAYANLPLLRGRKSLWANMATLTPMPGDVTRVTNRQPNSTLGTRTTYVCVVSWCCSLTGTSIYDLITPKRTTKSSSLWVHTKVGLGS